LEDTFKKRMLSLFNRYGMFLVLVLLCVMYSFMTIDEQHPSGDAAASVFAKSIDISLKSDGLFIVISNSDEDKKFEQELHGLLVDRGYHINDTFSGTPAEIKKEFKSEDYPINYILTTKNYFPIVEGMQAGNSKLSNTKIYSPPSYRWPTFLLPDNVRNVANQISVIAIIAIGMTMVIITAGIDLSVGSLIALAAVLVAWFIGQLGAVNATWSAMIIAGLGAIILCGLVGAFSGSMITLFKIPPFIATLAMMMVASGFAYILSDGKPIYQIPDSFATLGRGAEPILGIPYAVILMLILYIIAHIMMSKTKLGRYIYAVGGNPEAARLSGIRVKRIILFVYLISGLLAGLGGVLMASQLKSGAPTYGMMYELYVIAAVVVGGTSLSGGEGRIFGTLIGAFIIAVIQNGMNLTNVESYTQKVVLGAVILGAVMLDRLKQKRLDS
jgi:ribose/xylose/arabinose/galactoside ABC-type transport system permease subunit